MEIRDLFDAEWYLALYPDINSSEIDPFDHYQSVGWKEGRQPHPLFDNVWYLEKYLELFEGNPFEDYVSHGWKCGRSPHPLFDGKNYVDRYSDVHNSNLSPLAHYHIQGRIEGRSPHELFDPAFYLSRNTDVALSGMDPFVHFIRHGWIECRDPHPLFSINHYFGSNINLIDVRENPLIHYKREGWRGGLDPHPLFSVEYYISSYKDVFDAQIDPLAHYLSTGAREGRNPHPLFDTIWYLNNNQDVAASGMNPLVHFVTSGSQQMRSPHPLFNPSWYNNQLPKKTSIANSLIDYLENGAYAGLDPNEMFDSDWYLKQHELLRYSKSVNPLIHYVTRGRYEGRDPHPDFDQEWYLAFNDDVQDSGLDPLVHYLTSGRLEGRECAPPSRNSNSCSVLDLPYELRYVNSDLSGRDVCVLVTYSRDGNISGHADRLIAAYRAAEFRVVLVVVTEGLSFPLRNDIPGVEALVVRVNHGWDFAAWATVLTVLPELWQASTLILTNDSIYGPLSDKAFTRLMKSVVESESDIVALTDSYQNYRHYMSYFVALKPTALKTQAVREFWNGVRSLKSKNEVIGSYELPAMSIFERAGLSIDVLFPAEPGSTSNPTLAGWRDLIRRGFPFIKVQALRDDLEQVATRGWEAELSSNAGLLEDITHHLARMKSREYRDVAAAPVPAPKRRFKRPASIQNAIGAVNSVRPAEESDLVVKLPLDYNVAQAGLPEAVGVFAHIFYPELAREIRSYIENIPVRADVFVSTDTEEKKAEIESAFMDYTNGKITVKIFDNIGRDIAPMIVGYRKDLLEYEYVVHIHSKKSPHSEAYSNWRDYLLGSLLGSIDKVKSILTLLASSDLGYVFADHFSPIRNLLNWGHNFDSCRELLGRAGVELDQGFVLEFPSSSFFWARTAAMRPLLDLGLDWADFPKEAGQVDGTLAHAIERSLLYFGEKAGFSWVKVGQSPDVSPERLVRVFGDDEIAAAICRAHRPLLGNPIRPYRYYKLIPEEQAISVRVDRSSRTRLNLVIPTLRPELVFGGIATAIKTFNEIADQLGADVDRRIIVVSTPVNLNSVINLPDYRVVQAGSPYDSFDKTIVEVCDRTSQSELPVRKSDIFVTTAWWTHTYAETVRRVQKTRFGSVPKGVYLIQDFEAGFYPWSNQYGLAARTYERLDDWIAIINSEELSDYMNANYAIGEQRVVRYVINESVRAALTAIPRERVIMFYGRPGTARNCFEMICKGIATWQQREPTVAAQWRIVSVGETYHQRLAGPIRNLDVKGKLSLDDYGALLSSASIGLSFMVSPHPSYPPLEMASAGVKVITNGYANKDLPLRSPNIAVVDSVAPESIADALSRAVKTAEQNVGRIVPAAEIADLSCRAAGYDPAEVAAYLRECTLE